MLESQSKAARPDLGMARNQEKVQFWDQKLHLESLSRSSLDTITVANSVHPSSNPVLLPGESRVQERGLPSFGWLQGWGRTIWPVWWMAQPLPRHTTHERAGVPNQPWVVYERVVDVSGFPTNVQCIYRGKGFRRWGREKEHSDFPSNG